MFVKTHDNCAIVFGDERISYAQLIENSFGFAGNLEIAPGQRMVIFAENRPDWVYAFLAGWTRGAINVLVDVFSAEAELSYIVADCSPTVIICSDRTVAIVEAVLATVSPDIQVINLDHPPLVRPASTMDYQFDDQETALLLYTSGTTGGAKGVMLTWGNLMSNVRWTNDPRRVNETDRLLAVLPVHHSWPLQTSVLCPLDAGATVVFLKNLNAEELRLTMRAERITKIMAVPRLFEMLHKGIMAKIRARPVPRLLHRLSRALGWRPLGRLIFGAVHRELGNHIVVFISGGAKLDPDITLDFRAMGITLVEGYGLTETAPMVTWHDFGQTRTGSVGKLYPGEAIRFGEDGEIFLRGPNIMKGYWNKPQETAEVLSADGWFATGDLGFMDKDGYIFITGRKKDIIVLPNGKNVRPDLIEEAIMRDYPLVKELAVTERNGRLYGIVRPDLDRARAQKVTNLPEAIKWGVLDLYNQLAKSYHRIHDFVIVNAELPRTRLGKLKRFMLHNFLEQESAPKVVEAKPDYPEYLLLEAQLCFLTDNTVNPSDHLEIDVGLDSLSLVELQTFVESTFGITLPVGWTSTWPTVTALAEHIRDTKTRHELQQFDWGRLLGGGKTNGRAASDWMMRCVTGIFTGLFGRRVQLTTTGIASIPRGPCIIAPNHQSFIDSILLISQLPPRIRSNIFFLAKEKHFRLPFTRLLARHANIIVMDSNRNLVQSMQSVASALRFGHKVVIFPEGTRSRSGKLAPFKKTFAVLARELGVPVVPVAIHGAHLCLPVSRYLPRRAKVVVDYLASVYPAGLDENQISAQAFAQVKAALGQ